MRTVAEYLAKVPPLHAGDSRFMAELALVLQPFADAQALINSLPSLFDIDNAVGVQLDATGAWIGQSRNIPVPILNPWFSWDIDGLGWDQGYWQGPYDGVGLASLDDTTYRRLLYAVRLANACNGTQASILACLQEYFPASSGTNVFVIDATDFPAGNWASTNIVMTIGISGTLPTVVDLSILAQGLIPVQPAGCGINWAVTTVSGSPVFGFDVSNGYIGGWDVGAWGADPTFVIENVILS